MLIIVLFFVLTSLTFLRALRPYEPYVLPSLRPSYEPLWIKIEENRKHIAFFAHSPTDSNAVGLFLSNICSMYKYQFMYQPLVLLYRLEKFHEFALVFSVEHLLTSINYSSLLQLSFFKHLNFFWIHTFTLCSTVHRDWTESTTCRISGTFLRLFECCWSLLGLIASRTSVSCTCSMVPQHRPQRFWKFAMVDSASQSAKLAQMSSLAQINFSDIVLSIPIVSIVPLPELIFSSSYILVYFVIALNDF